MRDSLRDMLSYVGRTSGVQHQREAMIDLLIWTMYADSRLALSENDKIDRLAEEMGWDSPTPAGQYLNTSIAKIRDVLDNEDNASAVMDSIYERLGSDEMRRKAYRACRELAAVDGDVADEETEFLRTVMDRFHLGENE